MAKADKFIVTTPVVEIGYAWLRTPDTKFNTGGDYKCDFFMEPDAAKEFCARVESDPRALVKGKKAKLKGTKVDGQIKFKTKQHATITFKKNGKEETVDMKPKLLHIVDGKTVPYPDDAPTPFAGSKGELEVEVVPFEGFGGGLTMRIRAIRLHEIVGGSTASGSWSDVEDGYSTGSKQYEGASDDDDDDSDDDSDAADDGDDSDDDRW